VLRLDVVEGHQVFDEVLIIDFASIVLEFLGIFYNNLFWVLNLPSLAVSCHESWDLYSLVHNSHNIVYIHFVGFLVIDSEEVVSHIFKTFLQEVFNLILSALLFS